MKTTLREKIFIAVVMSLPFVWIAFLATAAFVAYHFIAKYW